MSTTLKPDYGEPWTLTTDFAFDITVKGSLQGSFNTMELANRAIACVNACAGMADPAAEIQAMREVMTEAAEQLSGFLGFHAEALSLDQVRALSATLAKLQPFTTPGA